MTTTALIIIQSQSLHRSIIYIYIRSEYRQIYTNVLTKEIKYTKALEIDSITPTTTKNKKNKKQKPE